MSHIKEENNTISLSKDQISSSVDVGSIHGLLSGKDSVLKKGPWTPAEDEILIDYVKRHGEGNWNSVQKHSGLSRCGKSCRLRWTNHLRPNLKKGPFTTEEEQLVVELHAKYGNKWARMTEFLPGRTDNEIKNYWNTRAKRLTRAGLPLYPSNLTFKLKDENLQNQSVTDLSFDCKQDNMNNIPDFIIEDPKCYQGSLSCPPPLPVDLLLRSSNNLLSVYHDANQLQGTGTLLKNYLDRSIINLPRIRQLPGCTYGKIKSTYNVGLHYSPSPGSCMATLDDTIQGSHALLNGTSPSLQPQLGAAKMELPSFQYPDVKTDTFSCSTVSPCVGTHTDAHPGALPVKSECTSLRNCNIFEASQEMSYTKPGPPEKVSLYPHATITDLVEAAVHDPSTTELETFSGHISPMEYSGVSGMFSPLTETSSSGSSDFIMKPETVEPVCPNKDTISQVNFSRVDCFLGVDWSSACVIDDSNLEDQLAAILNEDYCSYYDEQLSSEPSPMVTSTFELDSITWESMPPVRQIPEHITGTGAPSTSLES